MLRPVAQPFKANTSIAFGDAQVDPALAVSVETGLLPS